mgnify:CR=1 FL=1|jgi:hypothetical protein
MSEIEQRIYDILRTELSEITSRSIIEQICRVISKNPGHTTPDDIENLKRRIITAVLLFGGEEKARLIKERLANLK